VALRLLPAVPESLAQMPELSAPMLHITDIVDEKVPIADIVDEKVHITDIEAQGEHKAHEHEKAHGTDYYGGGFCWHGCGRRRRRRVHRRTH